MNRDPILFRVDGTLETGWERLTRCMVYGAALQRRRRPTYFLSRLDPQSLAFAIKRTGSDWLEADGPVGSKEDAVETIQEIRRLRPAAVIVDSPNANEEYLADLAATGCLVVSIDHQANHRLPSQLVINPLLAPGREAYEFRSGAQLLLGQRYVLIRSEIRRLRQGRSQEPAAPFSALVMLGDDDVNLKCAEIARFLIPISKLERIDIVVRPEHPGLASLQELAAAHADRVKVLTETPEIASRLIRCHFAVTSGSGNALELACIGVPQLLVVQSEAYWPTAQRLEEEGAAAIVGWHDNVSAGSMRQAVMNLLTDPAERQAMARCGRQLIDGRGPDRLVTALEVMLHPSRMVGMGFGEAA